MPDQEFYGSVLGGHTDMLFSHPVYWTLWTRGGQAARRAASEVRQGLPHRHRGRSDGDGEARGHHDVDAASAHQEQHGLSRRLQGQGVLQGSRTFAASGTAGAWGSTDRSGGSARYRCLPLLDETSNWFADDPTPPKYIMAISEVQTQAPGDDIYSSRPSTT